MGFSAHAQLNTDYSAYRDSLLNSYSGFRINTLSEYDAYRDKINSDYISFLSSAWSNYKRHDGDATPTKEIPNIPPVVYEDQPIKTNPTIEVTPEEIPSPKPQPTPNVPIENKQKPIQKFGLKLYGTPLVFSRPELTSVSYHSSSNDDIASFWAKLSDGRMDILLQECLEIRTFRSLNDWAYLNMLMQIGQQLYPQNKSAQVLACAYLYSNSGYKMRLGRSNGNISLLYASEHYIYNKPYFFLDGVQFYPLGESEINMEICTASFDGEKPLSLLYTSELKLDNFDSPLRELTSTKGVKVQCKVNSNLMDFYTNLPSSALHHDPLSKWAMTSNSPVCSSAQQSLYPQLKDAIKDKSIYSQVNTLLNFVQTAFVYEYDDKVWGEDRAFYPDEVLYYPYCDCEDRTALFTRLVRDLVGLECAIVYYPGHLAAAVKFPASENVKGDKLKFNGVEYIICDPTYINSSVGMSMPGLDNSQIRAMILK